MPLQYRLQLLPSPVVTFIFIRIQIFYFAKDHRHHPSQPWLVQTLPPASIALIFVIIICQCPLIVNQ